MGRRRDEIEELQTTKYRINQSQEYNVLHKKFS